MFTDFPDAALPLIEVSDDKQTLTVNPEAAALLKRITCAICPVSVVELYRTGKSSLLNFLAGGRKGFKVGPSVSRCTRGVWIYGRPTPVTMGDGSKVAVVLLDTEGVGGLEADAHYDTRIFALATLLSSGLVYNSLGSIDEHAIAQLSFVAQLSKHVRFSKKTSDSKDEDGDEEEEDARRLGRVMPSFTWVLRDFALELCDEAGEGITANEYLERSLRPQRGYEAAVLERNRVRHVLGAFFPKRECRTLVRPVHDESKLQRVDLLDPEELRPEFLTGLEDLRDALFAPEHVRPKTLKGGAALRGPAYVELVGQFVHAVNTGGVPVVSSAWDHVSATECAAAAADAWATFEQKLAASGELPAARTTLERSLAEAEAAAFATFDARALGDAQKPKRDDLARKVAASVRAKHGENEAASEAFCGATLDRLYMDVVFGAVAGQTADATATDLAAAAERAWGELRAKYRAEAKGPAVERALAKCLAEKWPETAHDLARRLEHRTDAQVKAEHDKLVGARAQLAELEGSAAARARMLEDAQTALVSTQLERARHEARCKAAVKNVEEAQKSQKYAQAVADDKVAKLELELQKSRNEAASLRQKVNASSRVAEDPARRVQEFGSQPGKKDPCACVIA
mmetsp:Transcript_10962/g.32720  ORF Transcript_10962/g.32720 Transcript_10962/m.32720 type:complete len:630 (+) Transcript_10962:240-2129(+)